MTASDRFGAGSPTFNYGTVVARCAAGCASGSAAVFGSNPFVSSSSVCRAALFEGLIDNTGGNVTLTFVPAFGGWMGGVLTRNGITSSGGAQCRKGSPVIRIIRGVHVQATPSLPVLPLLTPV